MRFSVCLLGTEVFAVEFGQPNTDPEPEAGESVALSDLTEIDGEDNVVEQAAAFGFAK